MFEPLNQAAAWLPDPTSIPSLNSTPLSPVDAKDLPGVGNQGWEEVHAAFYKIDALATRPRVMLSMGADMAQFQRMMTHAYRAGCCH